VVNTLKQQMAADLDPVFLLEDEFAETVFYLPAAGGGARQLVGVWDPVENRSDSPLGITEEERGWLWCKRSASGGIDNPQPGDRLWIESEGTSLDEDLAWSFAGETDDDDGTSWALLFIRRKVQRMGGNHL
jgi:hypothetical protein